MASMRNGIQRLTCCQFKAASRRQTKYCPRRLERDQCDSGCCPIPPHKSRQPMRLWPLRASEQQQLADKTRTGRPYQQTDFTAATKNRPLEHQRVRIIRPGTKRAPEAWAAQRLMDTGDRNITAADPGECASDNTGRDSALPELPSEYPPQGNDSPDTTTR